MMEDDDVNVMERLGHKSDTETGKAAWKILLIAFGIVLTTLLSLIVASVRETNNLASQTQTHSYQQDQAIALLQVAVQQQATQSASLQRISDATVASLQALTLQLTRNSDQLNQLNEAQKALIRTGRPQK